MADSTWARNRMAKPVLKGGRSWLAVLSFCSKCQPSPVFLPNSLLTFDCWSDHAAMITPTVKRVTATTCILEKRFPHIYPAIRVVILPPDRRMICIGTEML